MWYSWDEVKRAVERNEDARLQHSLAETEITDGHLVRGFYLVQRSRLYLELIGGVAVGVHAAVMVLIFNYVLFVWILHVNFAY